VQGTGFLASIEAHETLREVREHESEASPRQGLFLFPPVRGYAHRGLIPDEKAPLAAFSRTWAVHQRPLVATEMLGTAKIPRLPSEGPDGAPHRLEVKCFDTDQLRC